MEGDHGYFYQLFRLSWEAIAGGAFVMDLAVAFVLVVALRLLEKTNIAPSFWITVKKHPILEDDKMRLLVASLLIFGIQIILVAPHTLYKKNKDMISELKQKLNIQSPKLEGNIHRTFIIDEFGTSNSLVFLEASVFNFGETPSPANEYDLKIILTNHTSVNTEPINFSNEFKLNFVERDELWLLDLKRPQLISEKTVKSIARGDNPRGWVAFRLHGISMGKFQQTNIVLFFSDVNGDQISVTNGMWRGKSEKLEPYDLTTIIPGAENIFYRVYPGEIGTNWLPPELPPDCSNVVIYLGSSPVVYSRFMAGISGEGTKFSIKDVPDYFLSGYENSPNYSPRNNDMYLKYATTMTVGGKTFSYPVQPIIISNRLYVEVEIPFSNKKPKLVMSDSFDPELPIPRLWDRNYSTNYFANSIKSGGVYAYEVVNELTNPVLQVAYAAPNVVIVNGIFQVDANSILETFGQYPQLITMNVNVTDINTTQRITTISLQGTNFSEIIAIHTNDSTAFVGEMFTNEFYRPIFPGQRPIFKYPSSRHPGVFADDVQVIDK